MVWRRRIEGDTRPAPASLAKVAGGRVPRPYPWDGPALWPVSGANGLASIGNFPFRKEQA